MMNWSRGWQWRFPIFSMVERSFVWDLGVWYLGTGDPTSLPNGGTCGADELPITTGHPTYCIKRQAKPMT